jgi:predicted lysophospholipase L1 biosynthesis ABC-type transport system permease subunit
MTTPAPAAKVQRQISLPLSKAVEIAWQNIRLRLSRSILVTSGITLALAFLMAILTSDAIIASMRNWTRSAPQLVAAQKLEAAMKANGVPTTAAEIADDRLQHRWLITLALLVAFVGILNAMLMSVTERFREIGTMKCLGALDSFIVKLFLIESLFQGVVGTVVGVLVGLGLSLLSLSASYGKHVWTGLPFAALLAATALCLTIGVGLTVAAAVYPAWQAARMQPIEAMRVDT